MKETFAMFAAYNRWANQTVYAEAAKLTEEELNRGTGAFFGSLLATLNHLLAADRIWMKRFTGQGDAPSALNAILFDTLGPLTLAREAEDQRIISWIDTVTDAELASTITYTPITNPITITQRLWPAVFHAFNHQTHHRGQCHMMLTALGKPSMVLDLVHFQRIYEDGRFM